MLTHRPFLILTLILSSLVNRAFGIYYILNYIYQEIDPTSPIDAPLNRFSYNTYELWGNQYGTLPNNGNVQWCTGGDSIGHWEATSLGGLGACEYGDYTGNGNSWKFCQTNYGGNLYLNGYHKVCNTVDETEIWACENIDCNPFIYVAFIACWDDTWYIGG